MSAREFAGPQRVCSQCAAALYDAQAFCGECGTARGTGWREIGDDPWLGRRIQDRFLASKLLGTGSTGVVYRVEALDSPSRFALKIIDLDRPDSRSRADNLERARHEFDVVVGLENEHIVGIHDMLQLDERFVAIVMDYVEGPTLRELVETSGPLPPPRAIDVTRQVSVGLHDAHEHGLVHRDVKPENILVQQRPDGSDVVRITDFGIASPAQSPSEPQVFIGTPLWASPEQILAKPLDRRSDIYSLGATLYFLLTGQAPFTTGGYVTILSAHVSTPAPQLRDSGTRSFSRALERLVARMLSKQPEERPGGVPELLSDLDSLVERNEWDVTTDLYETSAPFLSLDEDSINTHVPEQPAPRGVCMHSVGLPVDSVGQHGAAIFRGRVATVSNAELEVTRLVPHSVHTYPLPRVAAEQVALSDRGAFTGHTDGSICYVSYDAGAAVIFRAPSKEPITAIAVDAEGRLILAGTRRGDLHAHGLGRDGDWRVLSTGSRVRAVAVSEDAQAFAVARANSRVEFFSSGDPDNPIFTVEVASVEALALSADGRVLAVLDADGRARVWLADTGQPLHSVHRDHGRITAIRFAESTLLGLCEEDGDAFLLDLECGQATDCTPSCRLCHLEH